jgi:FHA domain-containing protein
VDNETAQNRALHSVPAPSPADTDSTPKTTGDLVLGVYCRRSHFNDPQMAYCTVCGISMAQATRSLVWGERPAVGVLVLDDGASFPLMREHVFGRVPEADEAVIAGKASPVRLFDMSVSRVHARIVLDGWDVSVIDAGSTNGTFLCVPSQAGWTRLPRGERAPVRTGTVIAFGRRQLRYHSYRAQSEDFSRLDSILALGNSAPSSLQPQASEQSPLRRAA